jgi:hypothetical protein
MRRLLVAIVFIAAATPVFGQSVYEKEAEIRRSVPYSSMLAKVPGLTLSDYNRAVRSLAEEEAATSRRSQLIEPIYSPPAYTYTPPTPTRSTPDSYERRSGSSYDFQSGNIYTWRKSDDGTTKVNGTNLNTGSMWNTTIKPNGSMTGWDSKMNPWTYDAKSKTYMNLGTGQMCIGEGYARVCTK